MYHLTAVSQDLVGAAPPFAVLCIGRFVCLYLTLLDEARKSLQTADDAGGLVAAERTAGEIKQDVVKHPFLWVHRCLHRMCQLGHARHEDAA